MPPHRPDELPIFVKWCAFLAWLLPTTEKFPHTVRFTFADRIDNLALDIVENLVEARYTRRKQAILAQANLRLEKLRVLLRLCRELSYLSHARYEYAMRAIHEAGSMLGGWQLAAGAGMKRFGHLFEQMSDFAILLLAARKARRSKGERHSVARFLFHLEPELLALQAELQDGTYRLQPYHTFTSMSPSAPRSVLQPFAIALCSMPCATCSIPSLRPA